MEDIHDDRELAEMYRKQSDYWHRKFLMFKKSYNELKEKVRSNE